MTESSTTHPPTFSTLVALRPQPSGQLLDRPSTAQRVADVLRERVLAGELVPGVQMSEQQLATALGVSRNTLREAFQILIGERLMVHEPHRGVFVRRLSAADVRDIYTFRRLVECAALAYPAEPQGLLEMRSALHDGRQAAEHQQWRDVGAADVRFHLAVTAVGGSTRLNLVMRALFAELRLAFLLAEDPRALHEPFLALNQEILELAEQGERTKASDRLRGYLDEAETVVVAATDAAAAVAGAAAAAPGVEQ